MPIGELAYFIHHAEQLSEKESIKREDRLMRAYVNGWTVKKPKRYVLPMPDGTDDENPEKVHYAIHGVDDRWFQSNSRCSTSYAIEHDATVTDADLKNAPAWVKAIIPVEVKD
jgi:hypothetical protein